MVAAFPFLALFLLFFASKAEAGGPGMDRDGDGLYSLEELREEYPTLTEAQFETLDANEDGWVSPEEFRKGLDMNLLPPSIQYRR